MECAERIGRDKWAGFIGWSTHGDYESVLHQLVMDSRSPHIRSGFVSHQIWLCFNQLIEYRKVGGDSIDP